ncbi:hypothetical protein WME97_47795 [Sorangium sp. So ce367]|jgi:hypothetical protein|uniref:hypothetical protein n=1 Tax=Sorangium sp. So ce367 TaxID=3133305 RepID=UPI003F606745
MKLAIDLSPAQADRLQERAKSLGLQPEELARAAVADLLTTPDDEFHAAAEDAGYAGDPGSVTLDVAAGTLSTSSSTATTTSSSTATTTSLPARSS